MILLWRCQRLRCPGCGQLGQEVPSKCQDLNIISHCRSLADSLLNDLKIMRIALDGRLFSFDAMWSTTKTTSNNPNSHGGEHKWQSIFRSMVSPSCKSQMHSNHVGTKSERATECCRARSNVKITMICFHFMKTCY